MTEGPPNPENPDIVVLRKDMEKLEEKLNGKMDVMSANVSNLRWFVGILIAVFSVIVTILGVAVAILARAADLI